ncbi:MAG: hypothetical protein J6T18_04765 [Bacteroidaceae bacterium]|nr:hypothetical protein [Bacteroidaceae bacterium]
MIKFLFKSIVVVLLLLLLIPMCRLLWQLVAGVFANSGVGVAGADLSWGIAALFFTALFIFFLVIIFKD